MSKPKLLWKYVKYRIRSKTNYDVHSPFLFEFINSVLNDEKNYYAFEEIEFIRQQMLTDTSVITVEDFGAGSKKNKSNIRQVSAIAKNTLITPKFGKLLFRIANYYQTKNIIELGTSLGISTLYLSKAVENAKVITLEGSSEIANIASINFKKTKTDNVTLLTGEFSQKLPLALTLLKKIDLAFIDGNHRKQPTLDYFSLLLTHIDENSIIVFDDIHWSDEMEEAWNIIKAHSAVSLSIDLFFKGIIFFRKDFHRKQNFQISF